MEQRQADGGQSMDCASATPRHEGAIERAAIALSERARLRQRHRGSNMRAFFRIAKARSSTTSARKDAAIVGIGEYDLDADSVLHPHSIASHALLDAARHAHLVPRGGGIVRLGKRHRGAADRARQRNALAHAAVLGQRVRLRQRFSQYRGGVF